MSGTHYAPVPPHTRVLKVGELTQFILPGLGLKPRVLLLSRHLMKPAHSQTVRRRLGSVTLTGQGLGLGLGTSLFPVGAMEIKAEIT